MNGIPVYDVVIVGSSPGCLLEAIAAARSGARVCLVERRTRLGGAWAVREILGQPAIESGPHFFQSRVNLEFLAQDLGFDLIEVPRTTWIVRLQSVRFRMRDRYAKLLAATRQALRMMLGRARRMLNDIEDDRAERLRGALAQIAFHLFRYREAEHYFKGGCGKFLSAAEAAANKAGVRFYNTEVKTVERTSSGVSLHMSNGSTITAQELWLTHRSIVDAVSDGNRTHRFGVKKFYRNQVHLLVKSTTPLDFYLYRFIGLGFFALVNLTRIGNHNGQEHEYLLCTTLGDMRGPLEMTRVQAESVLESFKHIGVIPHDVRLLDHASSTYEDFRLEPETYDSIKRLCDGTVRIIGDIDFAAWVADLAGRWQQEK